MSACWLPIFLCTPASYTFARPCGGPPKCVCQDSAAYSIQQTIRIASCSGKSLRIQPNIAVVQKQNIFVRKYNLLYIYAVLFAGPTGPGPTPLARVPGPGPGPSPARVPGPGSRARVPARARALAPAQGPGMEENVTLDKFFAYTSKLTQKKKQNQDPTNVAPCFFFSFSAKSWKDPNVDTHILVVGLRKNNREVTSSKKGYVCQREQLRLKDWFLKTMKR